jgi:hypothetical protein
MVVSERTGFCYVCQPSKRATAANGHSWGSRQAQEVQALRNDHAVVGRQHGVAGKGVGLAVGVGADLARQGQFGYPLGEAAGDRDRLVPISVDDRGGKNAADTGRSAAHPAARIGSGARGGGSVARSVGGGFQRVEGGFRLEGRDVGRWEVEAGKFGHLVAGGIVQATDQHANIAHAELLGSGDGRMLP